MIFKTAYNKGTRFSVKIDGLDGAGEKWASTSEAVYTFAKKNFKDGEEVTAEFTKKGSAYYVTRVSRSGETASAPKAETTESASSEFKCSECGATLKDGKYKKCYTCNKKNPEPKTSEPAVRDSSTTESIRKQVVLKASADAVATAMQGQISDMSVLGSMISELYDILIKKI